MISRKKSVLKNQEETWAYIFIAPQFIGIMLFTLFPALASIGIAFTKWDFIRAPKWVGAANFADVLTDSVTWTVIKNTFHFMAVAPVLTLIFALLLALMLNSKIKGVVAYRTAFYIPAITSSVAVCLVWSWMFQQDFGLINMVLSVFGIRGPGWIASTQWAMYAVCIVSIWQWTGYNSVILLAGLKGIPNEYKEAAEIDGANVFQRFFHITLPLMTPSIFFVSTMMLINGLQVFNEPHMLTFGGPGDSTNVIVLQIYRQAFQYYKMGNAAVLSLILFVICLSITLVQFKLQTKWVNYDV